jgi:DNA-binding transcriptional regulator/RsmH inhibitor MraZ
MSDEPTTPPSSLDTAAKKPRGRPPKANTTETPQQRIERLKAELHKAEEAQKHAEQLQASIVGAAVIHRAKSDRDFRQQIATVLRDEIRSRTDLAAIDDLLR